MITRRRLVIAGLAALVLLLQASLVVVPGIDGTAFERHATELTRTTAWRYGYAREYHGAVLVKTRLTATSPPPPRHPRRDRLSVTMARRLRLRPRLAAVELVFYAIVTGLSLARRALIRRAGLDQAAWRWPAAGAALLTALFVTDLMLPYLVFAYGEPLFSTYEGPGGLSYSSLLPATSNLRTPAVSYGLLLQAVLIWPLTCARWVAEISAPWLGIRGAVWFLTAGFWSVVAASTVALARAPRRNTNAGHT